MAKTTYTVPITGDILTARNEREAKAARHFILAVELAVDIAREEFADGYNSEAYENLHYRAGEIEGYARALDWLGVMTREAHMHFIRSIFTAETTEKILAEVRGEACDECA